MRQVLRLQELLLAGAQSIALALTLSACAWAQVSSGTLTGLASDAQGARVPSVELKLTSEDTGVLYSATSNEAGEYTFSLLPSGRYRLNVERAGFQTISRTGIVMELGRTVRLDITLTVGQVTEAIQVSGAPPMLESENATIGQFIENKTILDMPLNGRRVGDLLGMMGNSVYIQGDVIRPRVVIAGGRADQQQWFLDGVNASNIALEVSQVLFNPPVEAVQEMMVHQSNYSAEIGNTSGGAITMTTKSGTNKFTGLAYEYVRNDVFDARNFFSASKPPLRWNMFGGAAGGPIIKNRTFFFSHIEVQRQRIGVVRLSTVPTDLQRRGDLSATLTAAGALVRIYDPATQRPDPANPNNVVRTQFPGNVIPASRIDPVAAKLAALYPLPNRAASNLAGANNFGGNATTGLNTNTWTTKVDHILTEKDRISVRYLFNDFPNFGTTVFSEPAADPNGNHADRRAQSLLFNYMRTFTPRFVSDFRFNWQPRSNHNQSLGLGDGWPAKLGLKGVSDRAFPRVNTSGFVAMGAATQERLQTPIHDTHIVESASWFRGNHSLKFGGELRLSRNVDLFDAQISGQLTFNVQPTAQPGVNNTGNGLASMLIGFPMSATVRSTDLLDRRAKYYALFMQDDWKVTPNLTLNLGLRWDAHTPRIDVGNRQNGFDFSRINPVSGTPGVITFAGLDGLGAQVYNGDYNNFAPRFGFAWKPFGIQKTVTRGGYGIFFGPPLPGSNSTSAGFESSGDFQSPDNGITAPFYLRDGFPDYSRTPIDSGFGAVKVGQAVKFAPEFIAANRRLGYTQQFNFSVQQTLGWRVILEAGYIGTLGHKLNGPDVNVNQVRPENVRSGNTQVLRPLPQFGNVTSVAPMWGNSSYHAMNIKVEKRFSNGVNFLANYTYSKFIDDVQAGYESGATTAMQNYYDLRSEKSLSGNDVRNRFVWSSVYELPFGKARKWMNKGATAVLLGGWNVSGIVTLQDGSPYGLATQSNTTNMFTPGPQRVNVLRNPALPKGEQTLDRWFDTSAVAAPAALTFGNSSRSLLTGPGLANFDFSLLKAFQFAERFNLQFRVEAFNAFNRANFDEPGRSLGAPAFGVIGSARAGRTIQLGIKTTF